MPLSFEATVRYKLSEAEKNIVRQTPFASDLQIIQGRISNSVVESGKNIVIRPFGTVLVKEYPLSELAKTNNSFIPRECWSRMMKDGAVYQLHFLPFGLEYAQNSIEAIGSLYIGLIDLINFLKWLKETTKRQDLENRYIFGISAYALGLVLKKHSNIFTILDEQAPLDRHSTLNKVITTLEAILAPYQGSSTYVIFGTFVFDLLAKESQISDLRLKILLMLRHRDQNLKSLNDDRVETYLRGKQISKATEFIR